MNWRFRTSVISPADRGAVAVIQEIAELVNEAGDVVFTVTDPASGDATAEVDASQCITEATQAVFASEIITIPHASILTWPTTPVQILPSPGADKSIQLVRGRIWGVLESDYTNVDPLAVLRLRFTDGPNISNDFRLGSSYFLDAGFSGTPQGGDFTPRLPWEDGAGNMENAGYTLSGTIDKSVIAYVDNSSDGNFTGGHADNYLKIQLWYSVADIAL